MFSEESRIKIQRFFSRLVGRPEPAPTEKDKPPEAKPERTEPETAEPETLLLDNIFLKQPTMSRDEAIKLVGEKLHQAGFVEEPYIEAMLERERQVSTYMGNGVAIPHGTNQVKDSVKRTGLVVCQFPEGVVYGSEDEKAFVLIGIAAKGEEHLSVIAALANQIGDPQVMNLLATTDSPVLIYKILSGQSSLG